MPVEEWQEATKKIGVEVYMSSSNSRNGFKRKDLRSWIGKA